MGWLEWRGKIFQRRHELLVSFRSEQSTPVQRTDLILDFSDGQFAIHPGTII